MCFWRSTTQSRQRHLRTGSLKVKCKKKETAAVISPNIFGSPPNAHAKSRRFADSQCKLQQTKSPNRCDSTVALPGISHHFHCSSLFYPSTATILSRSSGQLTTTLSDPSQQFSKLPLGSSFLSLSVLLCYFYSRCGGGTSGAQSPGDTSQRRE